jgi:hypothetical protein
MSRRAAWMLAALSLAVAPTAAEEGRAPAESAKTVNLPANEFHEECMDLAAGERLGYSFRAAAALEFNIHYHRDGKIRYPVLKKGVAALDGAYSSPHSDGYCLMWRNPGRQPVRLEYRFGTSVGNK